MKNAILPRALYTHQGVKKILYHNDSCILYKKLTENAIDQKNISISHCIVFVLKGKVEVKTSDGEYAASYENEMLFMPRDTYLISDLFEDQDTIEVFLVFIDHEILGKFLGSRINHRIESNTKKSTICNFKTNSKIVHYFHSLKSIYFDSQNDKYILELKILELLHLLYFSNQNELIDTLKSSENRKRRRSIESIMMDNYDKNLTVIDLANLSGRSLSTFNRDFKRKYGQTPKQWLIKQKMKKAERLLAEGINVTNCAIETGYSNVSHFIKAYKLVHGVTPSTKKNNNL